MRRVAGGPVLYPVTVAFRSSLPQPTVRPFTATTTDFAATKYMSWR